MAKKNNYAGGFSKGVVESYPFKRYTAADVGVGGYIGSSSRTKRRDKIVEEMLRETGLKDWGIAEWLTSGDGRHMMDNVDRKTSEQAFRKKAKAYTKNAFIKVAIWSHPDHGGTLASTIALYDKLKEAFEKVREFRA